MECCIRNFQKRLYKEVSNYFEALRTIFLIPWGFKAFEICQLLKIIFWQIFLWAGLQYLTLKIRKKGKVKIWIFCAITPVKCSFPSQFAFGGFLVRKKAFELYKHFGDHYRIGHWTTWSQRGQSLTIVAGSQKLRGLILWLVNYLFYFNLGWNLRMYSAIIFISGSKKIGKILLAEGSKKTPQNVEASGLTKSHLQISNFDFH